MTAKKRQRRITAIGTTIKSAGIVLEIVTGTPERGVGCPNCRRRRQEILITIKQNGILDDIYWEVCECVRCHHRFVVESLVKAGDEDGE